MLGKENGTSERATTVMHLVQQLRGYFTNAQQRSNEV